MDNDELKQNYARAVEELYGLDEDILKEIRQRVKIYKDFDEKKTKLERLQQLNHWNLELIIAVCKGERCDFVPYLRYYESLKCGAELGK